MLSIIVPVYNEAESLRQLHDEIAATSREAGLDLEIIFIDDGSSDESWTTICELTHHDERVSGIRFRRNFGKAAALTAGMQATRGENILMMDADLQDDPAEIPRFLARLSEGYDVVNGWKQRRLDPWHKVIPSRVFNRLVGAMTGLKLHDHNCGIKLFRSQVAEEIRIYGELHRFIAVFAHARGFRVTELPVNHRRRQFGRSSYGVRRFSRGLLDLFTVKFLIGFGQRPQHMLGAIGLFFFSLGVLGLGYLGVLWLLVKFEALRSLLNLEDLPLKPIGTRPLLAYAIASTILGAQGISLGLIAELLVSYTGRNRDAFSIAEETGSRRRDRETIEH